MFNLCLGASNVTIHVSSASGIALLLNTKGLWFKRFYRALYILPVVIPPIIVATVWQNMFDARPRRDQPAAGPGVGGVFGLPASMFGIDWLRQVERSDLVHPAAARLLRDARHQHLAGLAAQLRRRHGRAAEHPGELYEAAEIDGAGRWQQFKNVTLIFLRPAMLPYAIYGFVITFNLFYLSYFMSRGGPHGRTELLVTQAYRLVNDQRLYGVGGRVRRDHVLHPARASPWSPTSWPGRPRATQDQ